MKKSKLLEQFLIRFNYLIYFCNSLFAINYYEIPEIPFAGVLI